MTFRQSLSHPGFLSYSSHGGSCAKVFPLSLDPVTQGNEAGTGIIPFIVHGEVEIWAYHQAGIELVRSLHCPVTEAVAQVLLHKVWVVQDIVCYQGLLTRPQDRRQVSLNTLQAAAA